MNNESVIDMIFGVCFKIFQLRMKKKRLGVVVKADATRMKNVDNF